MTGRLADRTHLGPDHRTPDDVPLPGTEDLTPLVADRCTITALDEHGRPTEGRWSGCGSDLDLVDLDRLLRST